jgi:hypothetical protein
MILKSRRFIVILITASFIVAGCCLSGKKKTTHSLSNDLREWMIYSKSDTLFFDTKEGETEYYQIFNVFHDTISRHEKFSCDLVKDEVYEVEIRKFPNSDANYYSSGFFLYKDKTRLDLFGYYCEDFHTFPMIEYSKDDLVYKDVWFKSLEHNNGQSHLKVFYSKSHGLLEYEYEDGRKFKLRTKS